MRLLIILLLISESISAQSYEKIRERVIENKKLVVTSEPDNVLRNEQGIRIEEGNNLVFEYRTHTGVMNLTDVHKEAVLIFEISAEVDSFNLIDEELEAQNTYYGFFCWACNGWNPVKKGVIKGKKRADGNWDIEIDLMASVTNLHGETNEREVWHVNTFTSSEEYRDVPKGKQ